MPLSPEGQWMASASPQASAAIEGLVVGTVTALAATVDGHDACVRLANAATEAGLGFSPAEAGALRRWFTGEVIARRQARLLDDLGVSSHGSR
jgi:hypothetical protein